MFLSKADALEVFDLTNCGMSKEAAVKLASSLGSCKKMQLKEFVASRQRIQDPGIEALARVFKAQKSLRKIELINCGIKPGFKELFKCLSDGCDQTLESLVVQDNISLNSAVDELCELLLQCKKLATLDISDCNMKKKNCQRVADTLVKAMQGDSNLQKIYWNGDLVCSPKTARHLI